jgi:hypothetical protein
LGGPYGSTSDVIIVQPSSTGNTTCLPSVERSPRRFSVSGPVSQCQPFNVTYNTTLAEHPPSIQAFTPLQSAFAINETDLPTAGVSTYLMSAARQTEVVLLFDDGLGYREVSDLLTVGGDSTSDDTCVRARTNSSDPQMDNQSPSSGGKPSKSAIIGISAVVGLVTGGLAILMIMYISRERRRRREMRLSHFVGSRMVRQRPSSGNMNMLTTIAGRVVSTPLYASEKAPSAPASEFTYYPGDDARSLEDARQRQPRGDSRPEAIRPNIGEKILGSAAGSAAGLSMEHSLSSVDIEHILNMATIYSEPPLPPPSVAPISKIPSTFLTVPPFSRHLRNPSDVPADPSPHQSLSTLFPSRSDRISDGGYVFSQRLTVSSGPSCYSPTSAGQARATRLPTSLLPPRVSERVSSFPVSVVATEASVGYDY